MWVLNVAGASGIQFVASRGEGRTLGFEQRNEEALARTIVNPKLMTYAAESRTTEKSADFGNAAGERSMLVPALIGPIP